MAFGAHVQGRASITAAGSFTLVAAVSGARPHLTAGICCVSVGTGAAVLSIQETDADGTQSRSWLTISASAPVVFPFSYGDHGYTASTTGSRLIANMESSNSAALVTVTGYRR